MIKFLVDEIPSVNKYFSYSNNCENRVICTVNGQIKVLYCNIEIFEEFLKYIESKLTFRDIKNKFKDRYSDIEIDNFISTLLKEEIIKNNDYSTVSKNSTNILLIGDGVFNQLDFCGNVISTEEFISGKNNYNFDCAIIVDEHLSYDKLIQLNRKLYDIGQIYTQIKCEGTSVILGPLVIPNKTACIECCIAQAIKKLNRKLFEDKITTNELKKIKYSYPFPPTIQKSKLNYFLDYIVNDVKNFYAGNKMNLLDSQSEFDFSSMNIIKQEVFPTTSCDFCRAFNSNYIEFDASNMELDKLLMKYNKNKKIALQDRNIQYMTGGLRSKNEIDTKKILEQDLEKLKVRVSIEPAIGNPFHDKGIITCFNSKVEASTDISSKHLIRRNDGAGKGITKEQAFFSSAFELLEHTCLQYRGDIPIISAKYSDVKDFAINMPAFSDTIKNTETFFDEFDEELEIDWVVANSIIDSSVILVPASFVFMYDVDLKGVFFGATSNGAAAGTTIEDAILHGLLETIERDAWIIGQSNPYVLPLVDYNSVKVKRIQEIIFKIQELGYEILTRDYTNDIGIPVYRTWIVDKKIIPSTLIWG